MRILLDECVPRRLGREFVNHEVRTVPEMGWSGTKDEALLQRAAESFDVLLTTDRNLAFQQNLTAVYIGIVVMHAPSNDITMLRRMVPAVLETLLQIKAGEVVRVYPYP